jgi:CBS domain-containing protein
VAIALDEAMESPLAGPASSLSLQVRSLLARAPVTCRGSETVAAASQRMVETGVGSVIVLDPAGRPEGIVTDRDLRERVLAAGRPAGDAVSAVMSSPLVSVSPEAFVFEALLEMTRRNIHHLAVVEADRLVGVVSSHDLLLVQAAAPLEVARMIEACGSLDALEPLMPRLTEVTRRLFEQGVSGYQIGRIVSEINDMVIRKVLAFTEHDLREGGHIPPVAFCWLVLGSEGRREQTLRTDQDNALLWEDSPPALAARARGYFEAFAERAIAGMVRLGYPPCPAGSMASNPKWNQPLSVWEEYFADWVRDTSAEHLMYASIYLDFRSVAGEPRLADGLRDAVRGRVRAWRSFPRHLARIAVSHSPPLGLFGRFRVRRENGRRGVNLKLGGMLLLNNALRAYAVDLGLAETNTLERLEAATRAGGCFTTGEAEDVRHAYETIFRLRLGHQLAQLAAGARPDNLLDPGSLGRADQSRLRDAFRAIARLQGKVEDRYFTQAL